MWYGIAFYTHVLKLDVSNQRLRIVVINANKKVGK